MARHAQDADVLAVGVQVGSQDAGRVAGLQHHGARAVAEQHAGGAVVEIEDAAEHLGADHQRLVRRAVGDQRVGHRQRVDEAAAHRLHVEHRATGNAQLVLHDGRGGRKHHVRRGGGNDDQVDVAGLQAGRLQRGLRRRHRQLAGRHIGRGKVARLNAGALDDPFVRSLDAPRGQFGHQVVVGHPARRQVAAGAGDAGIASCHGIFL